MKNYYFPLLIFSMINHFFFVKNVSYCNGFISVTRDLHRQEI